MVRSNKKSLIRPLYLGVLPCLLSFIQEALMKHIALIAAAAFAMVGCATNNTTPVNDTKPMAQGEHKRYHHGGEHRGEQGRRGPAHPHTFSCEQGASVVAKYNPDTEIATLNVTAPTLSLSNQTIELKHAVSGSGERYVNDANPASVYEWHTKGKDGIFSVNVNNKDYSLSCEAVHPTTRPARVAQ